MERYGRINDELIRAKIRVLYRANDYGESLSLSKDLIEGDAEISTLEKAFLGRDAAICAEKQGDYQAARSYYMYGRAAAESCGIDEMEPMKIGLLADAALASWHAGDKETCIRDFIIILKSLEKIDPKSSLSAAHCHAVCRHVLLWLNINVTGDNSKISRNVEIFPGLVSNPNPHKEITEKKLQAIEMAWYMLATIENNCLINVGVSDGIDGFLSKGPVIEGEITLCLAKLKNTLALLDSNLFIPALESKIASISYHKKNKDIMDDSDDFCITYGFLPVAALDQQVELLEIAEKTILCFLSGCIFHDNFKEYDCLIESLGCPHDFKVRDEFLRALGGHHSSTDVNSSVSKLVSMHRMAVDNGAVMHPKKIFDLVFRVMEIAGELNHIRIFAESAFNWLVSKWHIISTQQRFQLICLSRHERSISKVITDTSDVWEVKIIDLLQSMLPTIGFSNEEERHRILNELHHKLKSDLSL